MQLSSGRCPRQSEREEERDEDFPRWERREITFLPVSACQGLKKKIPIVQYVTEKSATRSIDVELPLRALDGFLRISTLAEEKKSLIIRNGGWSVLTAKGQGDVSAKEPV